MVKTQLFLLTGSNLGDKLSQLNIAEEHISIQIGAIVNKSSIYKSKPWGFEAEQDFLNQVLVCDTNLNPSDILDRIISIEQLMGRERNISQTDIYTSRVIDIDILFVGNTILNFPNLQIPHPRLHLRRFTLLPLNEIAPKFIHPILKKSILMLLDSCEDNSIVSCV